MALPIAPVAGLALRYGAVALAAYATARRIEHGRRDQRAEDALDDTPEGLSLRHEVCPPESTTHITGRLHRTIRLGETGPGVEIDISALGRIRLRRL